MTESNIVRPLKVAVVGFGVVGAGIIERLVNGSMPQLVLSKVVVKDPKKARTIKLPPGTLTTSVEEVLKDPEIDIVIDYLFFQGGHGVPPLHSSKKGGMQKPEVRRQK